MTKSKDKSKYPKKVFRLNTYFVLPDDFKGAEQEAFELLLEYYKSNRKIIIPIKDIKCIDPKTGDIEEDAYHLTMWDEFLTCYQNGGRVTAEIGMSEYDEQHNVYDKVEVDWKEGKGE